MNVITDGTEQLINFLANDTPLQLPTFRHAAMPSSQSHQAGEMIYNMVMGELTKTNRVT